MVTWIAPNQVDLFSASCSNTSCRVTTGFVQPNGQPHFESGGAWRSSDRVFDGELRATSVEIASKSCCATKRAACVFRTRKSRSCVPRTLCSRTRPERTERSKTRTRVTVQLRSTSLDFSLHSNSRFQQCMSSQNYLSRTASSRRHRCPSTS